MKKIIKKSKAEGIILSPSSKSVAHRMLIGAAMCKGQCSVIKRITPCEDVLATIDCLRALGTKIEYKDDVATVFGIDFLNASPNDSLNCRESGSTLRFLIPLALLSGNETSFTGSGRLMERPQGVYEKIADEQGLEFTKDKHCIKVRGPLSHGEYLVNGGVSSQFITGLLFALSTLNLDSRIIISTPIESKSYIDITISVMSQFGVDVVWEKEDTLFIKGGQTYQATDLTVEGDWSGAAFLEAFNYIGGKVSVNGLDANSHQGDRVCIELFKKLDKGFADIIIEDCPDLAPILFVSAAYKNGGRFTGTRRLKIKESDRAEVMREELSKFGAELLIEENSVTIPKRKLHSPKEILLGHNDHRIVMSLAVLCSVYGGEIDGCEAVKKSYPDFFEDIKLLGIQHYETN